MTFPDLGSTVHVWPAPGLTVSALEPPILRPLPPDGAECVWSPWLQRRYLDGSICLTDPRPAKE